MFTVLVRQIPNWYTRSDHGFSAIYYTIDPIVESSIIILLYSLISVTFHRFSLDFVI